VVSRFRWYVNRYSVTVPGERPPIADGGPLPRTEQQRRTRDALITSARAVFAREGFHRASLDTVAREAGLSKGAVYSNFEGKAALFLAVMDAELACFDPETWDPTQRYDALGEAVAHAGTASPSSPEIEEAWGFGVATLEFIASAARDPTLKEALGTRIEQLRTGFTAIARRHRTGDDPLDVDGLAAMLLVFDQGLMSLALAGWARIDADTARRAMRRMLRPADAEDEGF
jgi:AcrR family transcriptional regulator